MLEDFTRLNEVFGINEPMFLPKEENIEYLSTMTEQERKRISERLKDYYANNPASDETRRKISEFHKGKQWWLGKNLTEEHKKKCAKAKYGNTWNSRTFKITYEDGREEIVLGLRKFCRENNYSSGCLTEVHKGRRPKHKDIVAVEKLSKTP